MCDTQKYSQIYKDISKLQAEDTLQLVMEARDKDERDFFEMIGNYLLQKKQKKVIEGNLF
ncbi:MAG: hypothetical protein ACI4DU_10560 [Lachnospiraceae bacterium]